MKESERKFWFGVVTYAKESPPTKGNAEVYLAGVLSAIFDDRPFKSFSCQTDPHTPVHRNIAKCLSKHRFDYGRFWNPNNSAFYLSFKDLGYWAI